MLTSITTIVGLTPLLAETSVQAQILIPLATSLAFGLFSATVIALFLVPVTLLPWLGGVLGPAYAVTAMAAGTFFIVRILQAIRDDSASRDRRVFSASLLYLTVLFAVMLGELVLR